MDMQEWFDALDEESQAGIRATAAEAVESSNGIIDEDLAMSTAIKAKYKEEEDGRACTPMSNREQYCANAWWHD